MSFSESKKRCYVCFEIKKFSAFPRQYKGRMIEGTWLRVWCKECAAHESTAIHNFKNMNRLRLQKYQMTPGEYYALIEKQDITCLLCPTKATIGKILVVDHNHLCCPTLPTCGKCTRGLLCHPCNRAIGLWERNKEKFERYLGIV